MIRRPPRSTRTATLFPYTTLFRSQWREPCALPGDGGSQWRAVDAQRMTAPRFRIAPHQHILARLEEQQLAIEAARARLRQPLRHTIEFVGVADIDADRQPARRSEEHTSELQSLMRISYAVFCLKKKKTTTNKTQ